jgi:hypothetical protein
MFTKPLETSTAEYQQLIDDGHAWFELLSLFKMTRFPQGLKVSVRSNGHQGQQISQTIADTASRVGSRSTGDGSPNSKTRNATDTAESTVYAAKQSQLGAGRSSDQEEQATNDQDAEISEDPPSGSVPPASPGLSSAEAAADATSPRPGKNTPPVPEKRRGSAKRPRSSVRLPSEEDTGYRPSPAELRALAGTVPTGEPAQHGHRRLNANVKRLETTAKELDREPARAMADLIEALLEVPASRVLTTVAERLMDQIPVGSGIPTVFHALMHHRSQRLTRKAIKLVRPTAVKRDTTDRNLSRFRMTMRTRRKRRKSMMANKKTGTLEAAPDVALTRAMGSLVPNTGG